MLSELRNEPLGVLLWTTFQYLVIWISAKPDGRSRLFDRRGIAALVSEIARLPEASSPSDAESACRGPMALLVGMTEQEPDDREQARAALAVSEWAAGAGLTETALAYSGLAAALGDTSRDAWHAGRLHRRYARLREADTWYRAADAAASREKDWDAKARALNSRGRLALDIGRYPAARRLFARALKLTRRFRLREREAETHHHLFAAGVAMRDHAFAERRIKRVIRAYGRDHPNLPYFAHDLAAYWMDKGHYASALTVLRTLLVHHFRDSPGPRLLILGSAARAAGGAGEASMFDALHAEFNDLRSGGPETFLHAHALLLVARGAVSLRRWQLAHDCLTDALESSRRTEQKDTQTEAEQLLTRVGWHL